MLSNWLFCFLFRVLHRHCAENAICHTVRSEQNWLLNDYIAELNGLAAAVLSLYSKLKVALEQGRNLTASLSQRR